MSSSPFNPTALFWRATAAACMAGAIAGVWAYPVAHAVLALILAVYAALLWRVPAVWLFVLPALVPVSDLAPWSGWFFLEEIDFFVLVTLAVGYWRVPKESPHLAIAVPGMALVALLGASYLISLGIGILPLSALDANAFSNYLSHFNSLRIAKGFAWAILLLPLLIRATVQDATAVERWFVPGMLLGLCGATLAAWWERWTFVGLTDFATDYRITGMFSAMHVGGAALDGFLALSLPFLLAWLMAREGWKRTVVAAALFVAASYAVLATFSRGLYLAYGLTILLSLIAVFRSGASDSRPVRQAWWTVGALLFAGAALWHVFGSGGYRTFAAFVFLFGALGVVIPLIHRGVSWFGVALLLPAIVGVSWLFGTYVTKGPYIVFALSALALVIAADLARARGTKVQRAGLVMTATSVVWLVGNAILVADYWGGTRAAWDAGLAAGAAVCATLVALSAPKVWVVDKRHWRLMVIGLIALGMTIPVLHSYRMQDRFGEARQNLSERLAHWRSVLGVMEPEQWAFGAGLGRFTESYFWKNAVGEWPGSYRLGTVAGREAIQLAGARYAAGYGESLRVGQRVGLARPDLYVVEFDAHVVSAKQKLEVVLCEKWLLYRGTCAGKTVVLSPSDKPWQTVEFTMDGMRFSTAPWYARPTMQFSIANDTASTAASITNISLKDSSGRALVKNGSFSDGFDHWFFTSDHHHLPWHAKNLWLNIYFDQGALGLFAFSLLLVYAFIGLASARSETGVPRVVLVASLGGFLAVGLFDSLLDVPRVAWLFYLTLFVAMLKPRKSHVAKVPHTRHRASAV